jgi:hypothetical protein
MASNGVFVPNAADGEPIELTMREARIIKANNRRNNQRCSTPAARGAPEI